MNFNFRENFQFKILNPSRKVICKNLVLLVQASDNKFLSTFAKDKDYLNNLAKKFKPQVGRPSTDSYKGVQKEVRNQKCSGYCMQLFKKIAFTFVDSPGLTVFERQKRFLDLVTLGFA